MTRPAQTIHRDEGDSVRAAGLFRLAPPSPASPPPAGGALQGLGNWLDEILLEDAGRDRLECDILPAFLARQRWFAGKGEGAGRVGLQVLGGIAGAPSRLAFVEVSSGHAGAPQVYLLPLAAVRTADMTSAVESDIPHALGALGPEADRVLLLDAVHDEAFIRDLLAAMRSGGAQVMQDGTLLFTATAAFRDCDASGEIRNSRVEQSNASVQVGGVLMLKIYRRLRPGIQPEIEMAHFLTETAGFANSPAFLGCVEYRPHDGEPFALAAAFAFVPNIGDAWGVILEALDETLAGPATGAGDAPFERSLDLVAILGRRTAEMHAALATPTDDADFAAEPAGSADLEHWVATAVDEAVRTLARLDSRSASLPEDVRADVTMLLDVRAEIVSALRSMRDIASAGMKIRVHGDFHLGQVLVDGKRDAVIVDFEGEPLRSIDERREKTSPLRDVAGMLRSLDYAAWSALDGLGRRGTPANDRERSCAFAWRVAAARTFLDAYWPIAARTELLPRDTVSRDRLLSLFLLSKAFYEIEYEAANRPGWLSIPIRGVLDLARDQRSFHDSTRDVHDRR